MNALNFRRSLILAAVAVVMLALAPAVMADHHFPGREDPWNNCTACHGPDLMGGMGPSCMGCHNDFSPPDPPLPGHHMPGREDPWANCTMCHGPDLMGGIGPSCDTCHDPPPPIDLPPIADADGPYTGNTGSAVQFDGSGSADDSAIVSYDWDFGDGGTGSGETPTHTYASAGTFTVSLTVTDDGGQTDTDATTAEITTATNLPPIVDTGGPYAGTVGQPVQFDASNTVDPDGDPLIYLWNFGDDTPPPFPSQSPLASHTFAEAGTYIVQLAVTDGVNDPVLVETTAEISDAPEPPEGDTWNVQIPFLFAQFNITLEDFAGILLVETTQSDGSTSIAIGMEFDGVIFWMDISGAIFFGNIDRNAGSMSGIVFGYFGGSSVWFAEQVPEP